MMIDAYGWPKPGGSIFLLIVLAVLLACSPRASADTPATAVLYPEIREPFRGIFTTIADGIRESVDGHVVVRSVRSDDSIDEIRQWLNDNDIAVVVALGSRGQEISDQLSDTLPVLIGGIQMSPELRAGDYYGISLNPDPGMMLKQLKSVAPDIEHVTFVHHRQRDRWVVEQAAPVAEALGITIDPIPVDRLQEAAMHYREIMATQRSRTQALWLSQDSAVLDDQAILPVILKEAWDRRLIVFSGNPAHVRRGVLFARYPDNHAMGRSLGEMVMQLRIRGSDDHKAEMFDGILPLQDLKTAFNIRTAGRLGIRYTRESLEDFDLIFPPR